MKTKITFLIVILSLSSLPAQSINVISPNGGERWEANSVQSITWESSRVGYIKIEFSLDNGYSWDIIESSFDAKIGSYQWHIIDAQTPDFLIRISDVSNPSVYDISDNTFSVYIKTSQKDFKKAAAHQVKIMPLGDSITWGVDKADTEAKRGYRRELYFQLMNAGYEVDFVGTLIGGSPSDFDRDNEGHGGWSAYLENGDPNGFSLHDDLMGFLEGETPDVILLHIGTNDISANYSGSGAIYNDTPQSLADEVVYLLDTIYAFSPDVITFIARIINRTDAFSQKTSDFNDSLQHRIDSLTALERKIVVVDMENGAGLNYNIDLFPPYSGDLSDATHPNESGYIKMADKWFDELQNYFQPVLASPANDAVNQPINLALTWYEPPADNDMAVVYEVQVATDPGFIGIVFTGSDISSNSIQPTGLSDGTQYYWRVKIQNYGWSEAWSFTTIKHLQVDVTVFLEGPYNNGSMNTTLNSKGFLKSYALNHPYNSSPWFYSGIENVDSGFFSSHSSIVDWVLVELCNKNDPASIISKRAGLINSDGKILDTNGIDYLKFNNIPPDSYFISIKHRNHIGIMSSIPVALIGNTYTYDFTSDSSKFLGGGLSAKKLNQNLPEIWGMIAGDGNGDGIINSDDLIQIWRPQNGSDNYAAGDYNLDGYINALDKNFYWRLNVGANSQYPTKK